MIKSTIKYPSIFLAIRFSSVLLSKRWFNILARSVVELDHNKSHTYFALKRL